MAFPFSDIELSEVHRTTRSWHRFEDTATLAAHEGRDMSLAHVSPLDEARFYCLARMLEVRGRGRGRRRRFGRESREGGRRKGARSMRWWRARPVRTRTWCATPLRTQRRASSLDDATSCENGASPRPSASRWEYCLTHAAPHLVLWAVGGRAPAPPPPAAGPLPTAATPLAGPTVHTPRRS